MSEREVVKRSTLSTRVFVIRSDYGTEEPQHNSFASRHQREKRMHTHGPRAPHYTLRSFLSDTPCQRASTFFERGPSNVMRLLSGVIGSCATIPVSGPLGPPVFHLSNKIQPNSCWTRMGCPNRCRDTHPHFVWFRGVVLLIVLRLLGSSSGPGTCRSSLGY